MMMVFQGETIAEINDSITAYAKTNLSLEPISAGPKARPGRPKMSRDEHLRKKDAVTWGEVNEALAQLLEDESCGPAASEEIFNSFEIIHLSQLEPKQWERFIKICRARMECRGI